MPEKTIKKNTGNRQVGYTLTAGFFDRRQSLKVNFQICRFGRSKCVGKGEKMIRERTVQRVYKRTWRTSVLFLAFHEKAGHLDGEIFNIHIPAGIPFHGVGDMILKMDRIYDLLDYPQSEYQIREWDKEGLWKNTPLESDAGWNYGADAAEKFRNVDTGSHPLVYVETRFRRYGSWQGIMQAGKKKVSYRSTLEFLHYIMGYVKENNTK